MFYKYENDEWYYGLIIYLPSGDILSEDNKVSLDGWEWYDESPIENNN